MTEEIQIHSVSKPVVRFYHWAIAVCLVLLMVGLNVRNLKWQSITVDEYAHLPAGYSYLVKRDFRIYPKNPPLIKMLAALPLTAMKLEFPLQKFYEVRGAWAPWEFADAFVKANRENVLEIWAQGRAVIMFIGAVLAFVVFIWTSRLYGAWAGLLAMFLTVTSPDILAHAGVVTTDLGFTLFFGLTMFFLWLFFEKPDPWKLILAAVFFGCAQLSKFSGLMMIPILVGVFTAQVVRFTVIEGYFPKRALLQVIGVFLVVVLMGLAIINGGYFGNRIFESLAENARMSGLLKSIGASRVGALPLPFPADYISGLDAQLADTEKGEFPNYINGEWRKGGVWYYFLEALLLKTPLPTILLIMLGTIWGIRRALVKNRDSTVHVIFIGRGQPAWIFAYLPALLFLLIANVFGNLQLGVRYVLPLLPLSFICAGGAVASSNFETSEGNVKEKILRNSVKVFAIVLCLWQVIEVGISYPHHLSYFNELAGGRKGGHRYLIDSNIDWGQDLPSLKAKMDELGLKEIGLVYFGHADPRLYGIKYHLPRVGDDFIAVSVNFLYLYPYALTYLEEWSLKPPMIVESRFREVVNMIVFLSGKEPAERIGGSIYLYDLRGS